MPGGDYPPGRENTMPNITVKYLTNAGADLPLGGMFTAHDNEAEAVRVAHERGKFLVWKLPAQNTWLVEK